MKTALLLVPSLTVVSLLSSCNLTTCDKPPQPRCTAGTVLRQTCMAGTLIQLDNSNEGQTIQFDPDGSGFKTYNHVVSTYTALGSLIQPGTKLSFTLTKGGTAPGPVCQAADAPIGMNKYTLSNIAAGSCADVAPTPNH